MSTNFKHKDQEELKFNISSVASGKDILSLTKVLGDMIDGNGPDTKEKKNSILKNENKEREVHKSTEVQRSATQSNRNPVVRSNSIDEIKRSNSVDNFRELFSYRKPILLEELEKAHRSLSEEVLKTEEEITKTEENYIEAISENDNINNSENPLNNNETDLINLKEQDLIKDGKIDNSSTDIVTEIVVENNVNILKNLADKESLLNITFELSDNEDVEDTYPNNQDAVIEEKDFSDTRSNVIETNLSNKIISSTIQNGNYNEYGEAADEIVVTTEKIVISQKDTYSSTQAALAKQRITELIEEREKSNTAVNQITFDTETKETKKNTIKNINYRLPSWNLLNEPPTSNNSQDTETALNNAVLLEETLANFGVKAQVTNFSEGPTITRYEIQPAPGVKVSRIVNLADDIALCLAAGNVRIEAPIPGKSAVGIEVPNHRNQAVFLKEIIADGSFVHGSSKIMVALGKDIAGKSTVADLSRMPHLLIAGSTGSGKSVCMNSIITSILFRANPDEVKFLMVDPKMVELSVYNGIPHLISPVITDPKKATAALKWVVNEMENRYNLFASNGVRNLESYNKSLNSKGEKPLPLVVVLIDELADLMMVASRDVEESICRLAQKARAAGIHLVIATQRPSVDVITGIIKANIPSRIAFAVSSQIDSRTILDLAGAEKLLGRGDMLFSPIGTPKPLRVQGVYVSDDEVEEIVGYWKKQGKPEYEAGVLLEVEAATSGISANEEDDELLNDAIKLILQSGQASVSLLQRRFRIGYTRAARLIDLMEERGIIGGYEGSKPRSVLMSLEDWLIENGE